MQVKQEVHTGFRAELGIIPAWAWVLGVIGGAIVVVMVYAWWTAPMI